MKIIILASSEEEGIAKRNDIFQIFESDILAEQSGRLYQDGYYLNCYIVASKKAKWYLTKRYIEIEVTIATDQPDWVQEREFNFLKTEGTTVEMDNLKKYPYKYGYYYLYHGIRFCAADIWFRIKTACEDWRQYLSGQCIAECR